jgi:hypothetical protein
MKRIWQTMSARGTLALVVALAVLVVALGLRPGRGEPVPRTLAYQGVLTDIDGRPISGMHDIAVSLYADAVTEPALCTESDSSVTVTNGLFRIVIGDGGGCTLDPAWFTGASAVYLGIQVDDDEPLSPRLPLFPVATAFQAEHAETAAVADRVVVRYGSKEISAAGIYCGMTELMTGSLGGYAGAKALCEVACGDAAAHMCMTDEIVRSLQLGMAVPAGTDGARYSSGTASLGTTGFFTVTDCEGWRSATVTYGSLGLVGATGSNAATVVYCNQNRVALCCR